VSGQEWLDACPDVVGAAYDDHVYEAASSGLLVCDWTELKANSRGRVATFPVTADALYIVLDDGSRYRPQVSAALQQRLADFFGGFLPTSAICDMAYMQTKNPVRAVTLPAGPEMATVAVAREFNSKVEALRADRTDLFFCVGKDWILSNLLGQRPHCAVNYGFYDPKAPYESHSGMRMWQTRGTRHDPSHRDYSQICHLIGGAMVVNGVGVDMKTALSEPEYNELVSDEGVLRYTRQP
jgi:hypothetical protein